MVLVAACAYSAGASGSFRLQNDYQSRIYKENRDDWRKAETVVTTVQSLLFNNTYQQLFSPSDFDWVISDAAHRAIGGNARALFGPVENTHSHVYNFA